MTTGPISQEKAKQKDPIRPYITGKQLTEPAGKQQAVTVIKIITCNFFAVAGADTATNFG
jgi:hypothetical protein